MYDLYKIILDLCEKKGISGGKMCSDIGLSRSFMTELKKGRAKTITYSTASKLADYFNVSIDYFSNNTEKAPDAETPRAKENDEFIKIFETLPEEKQQQVLDYLRYVAGK